MAPRPEETHHHQKGPVIDLSKMEGNEVVVSGISGRFPESDSVQEFMENLFNKVDMVTNDDRRWTLEQSSVPKATGKINDIDKFDSQFFGLHHKQAMNTDPMARITLENAFSATYDAGVNIHSLRGSRTGVFLSVLTSDAENILLNKHDISGHRLVGSNRSMMANRISYWLGSHGPSYTIDAESSGSFVALQHAYTAIKQGICDAAIVGGTNICVNFRYSEMLNRLGVLSPDGKTRCFDKDASGYGRAETLGAIFLQRANLAKRAYAQVVHVKVNYNLIPDGDVVMLPNNEAQRAFLEDFYREVDLLPSNVSYVEAFGCGLPQMDKDELEAIDEVFCKDRSEPLYVGCVKSNMGHAESASGFAGAAKIILSYHKGEIAPNLHYENPIDVAGVKEGRLRVVTEPTPLPGVYMAANTFSLTGIMSHALFKDCSNAKKTILNDALPRLITMSGRSEEHLRNSLKELATLPIDVEQISLIHNVQELSIRAHLYRGYNVIGQVDGNTTSFSDHVEFYPGVKRPIWFVYSGMGSQWTAMGKQLMQIPVFSAAISRCCNVLKPQGIDLLKILTDNNPKIYDNILHSFVGIAAVQIGLTDILKTVGIEPDNIIGHSVGELGCAYADGCFTAEEMMLAACSRGNVSQETAFIRGSMAAVGVGYDTIKSMCPPSIAVACHNGPESCTISGPADDMKKFVKDLTSNGIFAKEVPCSNIAFHSQYIATAGPALLKYLKEVIKEPKERSSRWLSTSYPKGRWDEPAAKLCSAEYHTNNLLSPVLFEETSRLIPANAITIEIAPHGLLQAILRRSLNQECTNISLAKRDHSDNVLFLLNSIGKLFVAGADPKLGNLYPKIDYPVSVGTRMMSQLVGWEHSDQWSEKFYDIVNADNRMLGDLKLYVSPFDDEFKFLQGCIVDDNNLFPPSGCLVFVWQSLAKMYGVNFSDLSVIFESVHFQKSVMLSRRQAVELVLYLNKASGLFEISHEQGVVVSGYINAVKTCDLPYTMPEDPAPGKDPEIFLNTEDIYNIMATRGYCYNGEFRCVKSSNIRFTKGKIHFDGNWIAFLDGMIQLITLKRRGHYVAQPKLIQKISIDVETHSKTAVSLKSSDNKAFDVFSSEVCKITRCGGVEIREVVMIDHPPKMNCISVIKSSSFRSYVDNGIKNFDQNLAFHLDIVAQNVVFNDKIKIAVCREMRDETISGIKKSNENFENSFEVIVVNKTTTVDDNNNIVTNIITEDLDRADIIVLSDIINKTEILHQLQHSIKDTSFIITKETFLPKHVSKCLHGMFDVISETKNHEGSLILLKKSQPLNHKTTYLPINSDSKFLWMKSVEDQMQRSNKLVVMCKSDCIISLVDAFNNLRQKSRGGILRLLIVNDPSAPEFNRDIALYKEQLNKNVCINIYQDGAWGTHYNSPIQTVRLMKEHAYLTSSRPGDISSLEWTQGHLISQSYKIVQVYYAAVSEIDIEKSSERRFICEYGSDFSGRTKCGQRVMGLLPSGALSSLVEADPDMLWPVPVHWSLQEAATVPLSYANAFYCLIVRGKLEAGMSVLVHQGSSALGQAAINICLALKCLVFTTVGTYREKCLLLKLFPKLKADHVAYSNNGSFEDVVMKGTDGGCDIVLNTVSRYLRKVSMRCVGPKGMLVNANREDYEINGDFGMAILDSKNVTTASIQNLFKHNDKVTLKKIRDLIIYGISNGLVRPISHVLYKACDAAQALRFASTGRIFGRFLIEINKEEPNNQVTPLQKREVTPRFRCSEDKSYIVLASEDKGLELVEWLINRGAKNIVINMDPLLNSSYQIFKLRSWEENGVKVKYSSKKLKTISGCHELFSEAQRLAPVSGLFLAPRKMMNKSLKYDQLCIIFEEDLLVVRNLDFVSRKVCPELKQFVIVRNKNTATDERVGQQMKDYIFKSISEERNKQALPVLTVFSQTDNLAIYNKLDELLACGQPVVDVVVKHISDQEKPPIFERVLLAIGINDPKSLNDDDALERYGINFTMAREVEAILQRDYSIYCNADQIMKMKVETLKKLARRAGVQPHTKVQVLDLFFRSVDLEEFNAGDVLVPMPTLLSEVKKHGDKEKQDSTDQMVFIIPGMEGHKNAFLAMTERLKLNAFVCQMDSDCLESEVQEMAAKMSKIILKKLGTNKSFSILGYSFGVTIALEVAKILENSGCIGKIFCLDGSPRLINALLKAQINEFSNEQQFQDELIVHIAKVINKSTRQEDLSSLRSSLKAFEEWDRKIDAFLHFQRGRVNLSLQYQKALVEASYARIQMAQKYNDRNIRNDPLKSKITLLKASIIPNCFNEAMQSIGPDLDLMNYSQQPLTMYDLDCDHVSAPTHLRVTDILNSQLANTKFLNLTTCE